MVESTGHNESDFIEVPQIHTNSDQDGKFKILFPKDGFVLAEYEPIHLCGMCQKSPATCKNPLPRSVRVPLSTQTKTEPLVQTPKFKLVDGIAEGIITEGDIKGSVYVCRWFTPKEQG